MFALSLALVGAALRAEELPAGSALFTAAFGIGCALAPLIAALAMQELGDRHIFSPGIVLFSLLALRLALPRSLGRRQP